jgi:hypothetical protein
MTPRGFSPETFDINATTSQLVKALASGPAALLLLKPEIAAWGDRIQRFARTDSRRRQAVRLAWQVVVATQPKTLLGHEARARFAEQFKAVATNDPSFAMVFVREAVKSLRTLQGSEAAGTLAKAAMPYIPTDCMLPLTQIEKKAVALRALASAMPEGRASKKVVRAWAACARTMLQVHYEKGLDLAKTALLCARDKTRFQREAGCVWGEAIDQCVGTGRPDPVMQAGQARLYVERAFTKVKNLSQAHGARRRVMQQAAKVGNGLMFDQGVLVGRVDFAYPAPIAARAQAAPKMG